MFRLLIALITLSMAGTVPADTLSTTVNQTANGGQWNSLGSFTFQPGRAGYIQLSNDNADGYVIADAVRLLKDSTEIILDTEAGTGIEITGSWTNSTSTPGYNGNGYLHDGNTGQGTKAVRFTPLIPETGTYEVFMNWTGNTNRATNVSVTIVSDIAPPVYALSVAGGTGDGTYGYGEAVIITADAPAAGKVFDHWTSSGGGTFLIPAAPSTQFIIPEEDVTVTALYKDAPLPVRSSVRTVPQVGDVDIVVVGGNLGGISAALAAADAGATVLITSPTSSFSYDISAKSRFWLAPGENPRTGLEENLFGPRTDSTGNQFILPGAFKKKIEDALTAAGIEFLYYTNAVDVLEDESGTPAGVVLANKSGRQAVSAKVIIDATPTGAVALMAGATATPWGTDSVDVSRVLMFTDNDPDGALICTFGTSSELHEYTLRTPMPSGSWAERCRAETMLRYTWPKSNASWTGHVMHMIEPNHIVCLAADTAGSIDADALDLDACRPAGSGNIYVVSSVCAVSRTAAVQLVRPLNLIRLGQRIGSAAKNEADAAAASGRITVKTATGASSLPALDISEDLSGHHAFKSWPRVQQGTHDVPNWGDYDVIVVGGGTSGSGAAISAARAGSRVLVIEALGVLGGTMVNGIGKFWRGYRKGFCVEFNKTSWLATEKSQWLFDELVKAGGEVWFNTLACASVMEGSTVKGVAVATPMGRGVVTGRIIIDATGDGDICAWSGAEALYLNEDDLAIQDASHLGDRSEPTNYTNEFASITADPANTSSYTQFYRLYRKYGTNRNMFDFYPLAGIRETRHIVGDIVVTALDQFRGRTYRDMLVVATSDFDQHGYFSSRYTHMGLFPDGTNYIPYRSLLPKGLTGIMVIGRAKSYTHDALPLARMQPDLANEGYAAGYIAARCADQGTALRDIDLGPVQDHLVTVGNITTAHRTDMCVDSPAPTDSVLSAATALADSLTDIGLLMSDPARSLPLLRTAFADSATKLNAKLLCMMGDTVAVPYLASYLAATPLDTGHAFSSTLRWVTDIDGVIWALGMARDDRAVPVLCAKLDSCGTISTDFSHLRSLLTSLGRIGSPQAAGALHRFLGRPGVAGYHKLSSDLNAHTTYNEIKAYIEIFAATALYQCGDTLDAGRTILENYLNDWRGVMVGYAGHVLNIDSTVSAVSFDPAEPLNVRSIAVFPNPFSSNVTMHIPAGTGAELVITDMAGRMIRSLTTTGSAIQWDGTNSDGAAVQPGIYFINIPVGGQMITRRIVLTR